VVHCLLLLWLRLLRVVLRLVHCLPAAAVVPTPPEKQRAAAACGAVARTLPPPPPLPAAAPAGGGGVFDVDISEEGLNALLEAALADESKKPQPTLLLKRLCLP
jgi:hypothetical protein